MIDWNKPLRLTNDKRPVRLIYTLKGGSTYKRLCIWNTSRNEDDETSGWFADDDDRVENIPETQELWTNVYKNSSGRHYTGDCYSSRQEAVLAINNSPNHVSTVKVWEGE